MANFFSTNRLMSLLKLIKGQHLVNFLSFNPTEKVAGNRDVLTRQDHKVALTYPDLVLNDDPLLYWRLNETRGPIAKDMTGDFTGTYVGSPTFGVPPLTKQTVRAVEFSSATTQSVSTSTHTPLTLNESFAFECWVKMGVQGADPNILISCMMPGPSTAFLVGIQNSDQTLLVAIQLFTETVPLSCLLYTSDAADE